VLLYCKRRSLHFDIALLFKLSLNRDLTPSEMEKELERRSLLQSENVEKKHGDRLFGVT